MRTVLALLAFVALPARAADLDPFCTWSDARWEESGVLRVPDSDLPFAHVWSNPDVSLTGTLGNAAWWGPRFRVNLAGDDLAVAGDFDPNDDLVFSIDDVDVPLGPSALLVRGGRFSIVGPAPGGGLMVGPFHWAGDQVSMPSAVGVVKCEDITVHWRPAPEETGMLATIGVAPEATEMALPRGRAVRLHAAPDGAVIGVIQKQRYVRLVRVAEERDGWSRVAMTHWTGAVWQGWVPSKRLEMETPGAGGLGLIGGVMGGGGDPLPVRRCNAEVVLHATVGSSTSPVGTVKAGTPFQVESDRGGWWSVTFPGGWISPADDAALVVAADPSMCPEGTWAPPDDVLGASLE